jgi:hypothetical protein
VKINLGCGWDRRDGYVNVDFAPHHSPDVQADVMHLPVRSGVAEELLAQDVLEHLPRTSTLAALTEWRRVTKTGGVLNARFPSLFHAVDLMRRLGTIDGHRTLIQNLYGTQAYTGDVHLTSFTDLTIADDFHRSGYRDVRASLVDEWMWDVVARAVDGAPIATFWDLGLYQPENGAGEAWQWMSSRAELAGVNTGDVAGEVTVRARVLAPHDPSGYLEVRAGDQSWTARHDTVLEFAVTVAAHSRVAVVFTPHFAQHPAPGDARSLHCKLVNLEVTVAAGQRKAGEEPGSGGRRAKLLRATRPWSRRAVEGS